MKLALRTVIWLAEPAVEHLVSFIISAVYALLNTMAKTLYLSSALSIVCLALLSCSSDNDNSHTTTTTFVSPPPKQKLVVVAKPNAETSLPIKPARLDASVDPARPLLKLFLEDGRTFRVGEEVPIVFAIENAKLQNDGGEYRVRYIIDDGEMRWSDDARPLWISGWVPGKHTIRLELIGPDGWPYRNGNANVVTREIMVK